MRIRERTREGTGGVGIGKNWGSRDRGELGDSLHSTHAVQYDSDALPPFVNLEINTPLLTNSRGGEETRDRLGPDGCSEDPQIPNACPKSQ